MNEKCKARIDFVMAYQGHGIVVHEVHDFEALDFNTLVQIVSRMYHDFKKEVGYDGTTHNKPEHLSDRKDGYR